MQVFSFAMNIYGVIVYKIMAYKLDKRQCQITMV